MHSRPNRLRDIRGQKFGSLTAIRLDRRDQIKGKTFWVFRCECGNEVVRDLDNVCYTNNKHCGCLTINDITGLLNHTRLKRLTPIESSIKKSFKRYKFRAKNKGIAFILSIEAFKSLLLSNCHYCGKKPSPKNSIDRKDSSDGYTTDNSLPCCIVCNRAKGDMPYDDFIRHLRRF